MQPETLNHCRELVRTGKVGQALEALSDFCRQHDHPALDELLLLSGQWHHFQKNSALGLSVDSTTGNRIAKAILDLINEIEGGRRSWLGLRHSSIYWLVAAALLIVLLVVTILLSGGDTTHGDQSPIQKGNGNIIEFHNNPDSNAIPKKK